MSKPEDHPTGKIDKLVRDKIPQIITKNGQVPVTHIATGEEYIRRLQAKLREEVDELIGAQSSKEVIEETADVIEVLHAYIHLAHSEMSQVENVRRTKHTTNGGFATGVVLEKVEKKRV